jgi:phage terminase small subunit
MADVPTPGFQTLWSHQIESLRLEYWKTTEKHPDTGIMEKVHIVLKDISSLVGCTPKSVGKISSPRWQRPGETSIKSSKENNCIAPSTGYTQTC